MSDYHHHHYDDDDDDDFDLPIKKPPSSSNPINNKNPNNNSNTLKPRNGHRPNKKARPSLPSQGKENHYVALSNPHLSERSNLSSSNVVNTLEMEAGSGGSCGIGDLKATGAEKVRSLTPEEPRDCCRPIPCLELHGCEERGDLCGKVRAEPYAGSIESRLLRTGTVCRSGVDGSDEGESGDCDVGTQLNELMNLCSEVNDRGRLMLDGVFDNEDVVVGGDEKDGVVECPLCGKDITDMDEDLRYVHTNACLDRDDPLLVNALHDERNPPLNQGTDMDKVREFLRSLELSRYEDAFVREEIDWDTLQWLTEEDLISIGISTLGPRKKIVHALNNLRKRHSNFSDTNLNDSNCSRSSTTENAKTSPGNKLITEYFRGHSLNRRVHSSSKPSSGIAHSTGLVQKRVTARNPARSAKLKDIPCWCSIPGTKFLVDAFRFFRRDCSHWFLTHFHLDHYQGLTKNFQHGKIYCSSITAKLVNLKLGVPWERLHVLPLGEKTNIDGVSVTCLDANHCPGSIIILFEPPNGKAVLHTGDFRFREEMTNCSILQSCNIHTLILDTTYCNPQYDFPKQEAVIQFVIESIQAEAFNPKTLFLIGSYTVGKERLFLEVARYLRKKVYVGAAKLRLLHCLGFPEEEMQWFTSNEMESDIHVVPMWTIASFRRMKHLSNQYSERYNLIVAFSPTGWTFGKGKKKSPGKRWQQGTIIRYEVPYSEHSSFSELQKFVEFISPEIIIPSVNNTGPASTDSMIAHLASDSHPGSTV